MSTPAEALLADMRQVGVDRVEDLPADLAEKHRPVIAELKGLDRRKREIAPGRFKRFGDCTPAERQAVVELDARRLEIMREIVELQSLARASQIALPRLLRRFHGSARTGLPVYETVRDQIADLMPEE